MAHRSMNHQRLHRANSFIRIHKERAGNLLKKQKVINLLHHFDNWYRFSSFLTIPNAFKQRTEQGVTLLIIHSANSK